MAKMLLKEVNNMGRRTTTTIKRYTPELRRTIKDNLELITEKHKEIAEFDQFCKWFGNNLLAIECFTTFRNILSRNGFKFKRNTVKKIAWGKGINL